MQIKKSSKIDKYPLKSLQDTYPENTSEGAI